MVLSDFQGFTHLGCQTSIFDARGNTLVIAIEHTRFQESNARSLSKIPGIVGQYPGFDCCHILYETTENLIKRCDIPALTTNIECGLLDDLVSCREVVGLDTYEAILAVSDLRLSPLIE